MGDALLQLARLGWRAWSASIFLSRSRRWFSRSKSKMDYLEGIRWDKLPLWLRVGIHAYSTSTSKNGLAENRQAIVS